MNGLREAVDDLIDAYIEVCGQTGWSVERDTVEEVRAALAATEPALDVERLARALRTTYPDHLRRSSDGQIIGDARHLAAAYARLAESGR